MVEVAVEGDRAVVQERADDLHPLDGARQRLHLLPVDAVLRQQPEVATGQDDLGPPAGELVERGGGLGDEGRLAQGHGGDAGPQADLRRLVRRRGEQQP